MIVGSILADAVGHLIDHIADLTPAIIGILPPVAAVLHLRRFYILDGPVQYHGLRRLLLPAFGGLLQVAEHGLFRLHALIPQCLQSVKGHPRQRGQVGMALIKRNMMLQRQLVTLLQLVAVGIGGVERILPPFHIHHLALPGAAFFTAFSCSALAFCLSNAFCRRSSASNTTRFTSPTVVSFLGK